MPVEIEGLVVCRVAGHALAFPAVAVGSIGPWARTDAEAPHARAAFGLPPHDGKVLVHGGHRLVVDALEVLADRVELLPAPPMLEGAAGGALRGFVIAASALVPLLGLAEFSRFVSAR